MMRASSLAPRLLSAASVIVIAASTVVMFSGGAPAPVGPLLDDGITGVGAGLAPIDISEARALGSHQARLALVEFADFQCSFCATFAKDAFPSIREKYVDSGRLLFVYFHLPLDSIHPLALQAAEAAECAGEQGLFWELHDKFFERPEAITREGIRRLAVETGVDGAAFDRCAVGSMRRRLGDQMALAYQLEVRSTPRFFLGELESGGRMMRIAEEIRGTRSVAEFERAIERLLASPQ